MMIRRTHFHVVRMTEVFIYLLMFIVEEKISSLDEIAKILILSVCAALHPACFWTLIKTSFQPQTMDKR